MVDPNDYNVGIEPSTRNHRGFYVRDTAYRLMGIDQAGWALICQDEATCHYVDPACLTEISTIFNDEQDA